MKRKCKKTCLNWNTAQKATKRESEQGNWNFWMGNDDMTHTLFLADCPMQRDDPPSSTKCQKKLCKLVHLLKAIWKIYENVY